MEDDRGRAVAQDELVVDDSFVPLRNTGTDVQRMAMETGAGAIRREASHLYHDICHIHILRCIADGAQNR